MFLKYILATDCKLCYFIHRYIWNNNAALEQNNVLKEFGPFWLWVISQVRPRKCSSSRAWVTSAYPVRKPLGWVPRRVLCDNIVKRWWQRWKATRWKRLNRLAPNRWGQAGKRLYSIQTTLFQFYIDIFCCLEKPLKSEHRCGDLSHSLVYSVPCFGQKTPCQQELDQVLERISKMPFRDNRGPLEDLYALHIPNCDRRGQYNLKQVNKKRFFIGYHWLDLKWWQNACFVGCTVR